MISRLVIAGLWSLVTGLAGGWLVLSPWALGLQKSGADWVDATKSEVGTGLFLVLVALIGIVVLVGDVIGRFREVGLIKARPAPEPEPAPAPQGGSDVDMDSLLSVLAKVLADEVSRRGEEREDSSQRQSERPPQQQAAPPPQQSPERPSVPPETWRSQP